MNLPLDLKKPKWNYPALAFAIPCVGMLIVMMLCRFEPFGSYSMLYSDMYHQYYPFFVAFRDALRSGESLLYTWSVGLGMDYLGLISYYLASPFNLLSMLVPEKWLLEFFSLMMPVKLGLAGLFFALFLRDIFGKNDFSISVFGGFYGLCAWALGFQWNIMWLDTFALLPLVALGTVRLLREKKFILYTLTLFLSIYANYYIGLFTCIFVFLLFFCYEICRWQGFKRFFQDLCRIACFSALAIGMTAILELPALAALQNTQSSVNKFPTGFRLNMTTDHTFKGLLDVMRRVTGNMGGGLEPNFKEGLPNLYCGVISVFLAVLYMTCSKVKLRDKLCCLFLLTFFNLSFIIRQLDYIWHGMHFTNMIPYRFSFLYSFVVLYMAYGAWIHRKDFGAVRISLAFVISAALLACSDELMEKETLDLGFASFDAPVFLIYNGIFLIIYLTAFLFGQIHRKLPEDAEPEQRREDMIAWCRRRMYARAIALGVAVLELAANLVSFGSYFTGTNVDYYPRGKEETASMIRYMHEREQHTPFFRAETTHSQTLNDGALNHYYGVSTFTSSANVHVTEFMKALGYGAKNTYNRYCFEESSPVANLFLGLKYMIERQGRDRSNTWFREVHHYGKVRLLENQAYLPLGFLAEPELLNVDFMANRDPFQFQDDLLAAATGLDHSVLYSVPSTSIQVSGENVTVDSVSQEGRTTYSGAGNSAQVIYTMIADRDGLLLIHLDFPKRNDYSVRVNNVELYRENISLPQMLSVADVKAGDVAEIRIDIEKGESSNVVAKAAILDPVSFFESYQVLAASQLELTTFQSDFLEGIIDCNRDGLLYTSIPQNGNWQVTVDNLPAETQLVGEAMLSVPLTEGKHIVSFHYRNPAFSLGWKITAACFAVFGVLVYRDQKKRGTDLFGMLRKRRTGKRKQKHR